MKIPLTPPASFENSGSKVLNESRLSFEALDHSHSLVTEGRLDVLQSDQLLKHHPIKGLFSGLWRHQSGASIVEFALLVPFLVSLTIGIVEMSNVFFMRSNLNEVVRDAARRFAVGALDKTETKNFVLQKVAAAIDGTGQVDIMESKGDGLHNDQNTNASNDEVTVVLTVSLEDLLLFRDLVGGVVTFGGADTNLTFSASMLKY